MRASARAEKSSVEVSGGVLTLGLEREPWELRPGTLNLEPGRITALAACFATLSKAESVSLFAEGCNRSKFGEVHAELRRWMDTDFGCQHDG